MHFYSAMIYISIQNSSLPKDASLENVPSSYLNVDDLKMQFPNLWQKRRYINVYVKYLSFIFCTPFKSLWLCSYVIYVEPNTERERGYRDTVCDNILSAFFFVVFLFIKNVPFKYSGDQLVSKPGLLRLDV